MSLPEETSDTGDAVMSASTGLGALGLNAGRRRQDSPSHEGPGFHSQGPSSPAADVGGALSDDGSGASSLPEGVDLTELDLQRRLEALIQRVPAHFQLMRRGGDSYSNVATAVTDQSVAVRLPV